ncbi:MAG: hypothetical protein R3F55_04085 [Alphaproteobacteria bacterium]
MPDLEIPSLRATTWRGRLIAAGLLVAALAVLAGLYLFLWLAPDHAWLYALAVLTLGGGAVWMAGRRNGNFRRWRGAVAAAWQAERTRQDWAIANPTEPRVRRRSRLIGLGALAIGVLLAIAIGGAALLGDLPVYGYMVGLPALCIAAGLWMLVSGRQPDPRRRKRRR